MSKTKVTQKDVDKLREFVSNTYNWDLDCYCGRPECNDLLIEKVNIGIERLSEPDKTMFLSYMFAEIFGLSYEFIENQEEMSKQVHGAFNAVGVEMCKEHKRVDKLEKSFHMLGENKKIASLDGKIKKLEKRIKTLEGKK